MVFSSNPLSLSLPEPAFESWLRDTGYLEILDQRTSAAASATANSDSTPLPTTGIFYRLLTLLSLFTLNPFSKLTADDFSGDTPSWSRSFVASLHSYSFPSSSSQARFRLHENVKRYARNYTYLFIVFFASALYKMPRALVGLISCLALWDFFKFFTHKWGLYQHPVLRRCFLRIAQCATAVILILSNAPGPTSTHALPHKNFSTLPPPVEFLPSVGFEPCTWELKYKLHTFPLPIERGVTLSVSYAGVILHAAFRKLTPAKQASPSRGG